MRILLPFPVILYLLVAPVLAQEKFMLRYAFEPAPSTWVEVTQEMTRNMTMNGRDTRTGVTTTMWLEGKVTEVKDGVAAIEQRYARIKIKGDGPTMNADYDSDVQGSKPDPFYGVADLAGRTAKSRVDSLGTVIEFTLPEGLEQAMDRVGVSLRQGFEQSFLSCPKDPVAIGDSWQSNLRFPISKMGSMKAEITNKLLAMKDGVATIEQALKMDTSGVTLPGGMTMEVPKATGTMKVDFRCWIAVEATMDMEMRMAGWPDATMSMSLTTHQNMKQMPAPAPKPAETPKEREKKEGGKVIGGRPRPRSRRGQPVCAAERARAVAVALRRRLTRLSS